MTETNKRDSRGHDAGSPRAIPAKGWKDIALRAWKEAGQDNISLVASGVAFCGVLAMVPIAGRRRAELWARCYTRYGDEERPVADVRHPDRCCQADRRATGQRCDDIGRQERGSAFCLRLASRCTAR